MIIEIHNRDDAEPEHLEAALRCALRHQHLERVDIYVAPREASGWIEYIVRTSYTTGGGMTLGVIQRKPGEPVECHS
jgi:hypothetical protein